MKNHLSKVELVFDVVVGSVLYDDLTPYGQGIRDLFNLLRGLEDFDDDNIKAMCNNALIQKEQHETSNKKKR